MNWEILKMIDSVNGSTRGGVVDLDGDAAFVVGQMVRIGNGMKVYRVSRALAPSKHGRDHWLFKIQPAGSAHSNGAKHNTGHDLAYCTEELRPA